MPQVPASAVWARRSLHTDLMGAGASRSAAADAALVLGELVANAVEHGRPDADGMIEVGWRVTAEVVQVGVHDWGHVSSLAPQRTGPSDSRGRGLSIVDLLSVQWAYVEDQGTRIGAELRLSR
ncbi:ATP-binding protein [Nocardioides sp. CER19]|nr:ATP-binding protein [Nocardioides sp. CER19]MDH2414185.1 ATP-binding protein [Nocardioides sp. CER19]